MANTLERKLLHREITDPAVNSKSYRKLYSDRSLIDDLDIVNELDGHSGCVNALSWSKSGSLLASGSDDQHLNIHTYQPSTAGSQFQLTATVATGHTANIFSVKFMPHSNDRTVITAAGDNEVRIFDLEYAGQPRAASTASHMATEGRRRGRHNVYNGVRYLSDGDTDCRVYRSHGDRAKRIVTESSPYLFLTCSEDGEVRQWDLRQPSSAYPAPRGSRFGGDSNVPPPLISYKRYGLDLNTISCSASQPYYIALGGAHLHALLHDRRMIGRDRLKESGKPLAPASRMSNEEEELMGAATKCVRKFAPNGQKKMRRTDNGHITACKISDARPDEMIVSWSGDHIYSFDLVRSPGAGEEERVAPLRGSSGSKVRESKDRKRKRKVNGSETSIGQEAAAARASSGPRGAETAPAGEETALRIRYQNGQSEDIALSTQAWREQHMQGVVPLTERQKDAEGIAKASVKIRRSLLNSPREAQSPEAQYSESLGYAASIISDVDEIMRDWRYPMDPSQEQVLYQQTLRRNRESGRRFVQAAGTVARVLGGKLRTPSGPSPLMASFATVDTRSNDLPLWRTEQFGYDFVKAILLWLESGIGRLIEGFTRPADMSPMSKAAERLPIPESEATTFAVDDILIPYLLRLASDKPIVNVEASKFETDESRQVFGTEQAAVLAFAAAVKIPFADLSSAIVLAEGADRIQAQDRQTALRYWGHKVARGVLLNAAEGVNFALLDRAFGGLGRVIKEVADGEASMADVSAEEDEPITQVEVVRKTGQAAAETSAPPPTGIATPAASESQQPEISRTETTSDEVMTEAIPAGEIAELMEEAEAATGTLSRQPTEEPAIIEDDDDDEDDNDDNDNDSDESSDPDEEDGVPNIGLPRFMYRSAVGRRRKREKVEANVPCSSHTRMYRGHCNVKTVKDVNFFGLDDEYVVSGSDDGNFFVWDRKTTELVNVLQGDGEVVNVLQGHPYETMLAVSGIDHTIKIFSPDGRAREAARLGRGISAHDSSEFSSLAWPARMAGRRRVSRRSESQTTSEPAVSAEQRDAEAEARRREEDDDYVAPNGLSSRKRMQNAYQIMNQNDVDRQGGNQDAFITVRGGIPLHILLLAHGAFCGPFL